jgi:hypothetical protein
VVAVINTQTDTEVIVTAGARDAGSGAVIATSDTGATSTYLGSFTYVARGVVSAVSPAFGQIGTRVTVFGSGLLGGDVAVSQILLGGVAVTSVAGNETSVSGVVSARAAGLVDVTVVASSGARVTGAGAFTYVAVASVTSISPANGQVGTLVTIVGSGLLGGGSHVVSVTLGSLAVAIVRESNTEVVVRVAAGTPFTSVATLIADTGATVVSTATWTYVADGQISSIVPNFGRVGTFVTITGTNLRGSAVNVVDVSLSGVLASLTSESDTTVVARAALGAVSGTAGDVVLTASSGAVVTGASLWTYNESGTLDTVVPARGQLGTRVVLTGSLLLGGGSSVSSVVLAGIVATVQSYSCSTIVVTAGASVSAVSGDVVITSDTGSLVTKPGAFTYVAQGVVSSRSKGVDTPRLGITNLVKSMCSGDHIGACRRAFGLF